MDSVTRRGAIKLTTAACLIAMLSANSARAQYPISGRVTEVTDRTITLDGGTKYRLGGPAGKVYIFVRKMGGSPDWTVDPYQVKYYVKINDYMDATVVGSDSVDEIFTH